VTKSLKSCSSIVRKEIENLVYINMEKLSHWGNLRGRLFLLEVFLRNNFHEIPSFYFGTYLMILLWLMLNLHWRFLLLWLMLNLHSCSRFLCLWSMV
jgi:hypothetical protein